LKTIEEGCFGCYLHLTGKYPLEKILTTMKPLFFKSIISNLILCGILISSAWATDVVSKEKQLKKSFPVQKKVVISLNNKAGNINVQTWDKNLFTIEVNIKVKKRDGKRAQELIDAINVDIDDKTPGELIGFITRLPDLNSLKANEEVQVNYEIFMPKENSLKIVLKHGDLFLGKLEGDLNLKMDHGQVNVVELRGESVMDLAFVNGTIKKLNKGTINLEYASKLLTIEKHGDLKITSKFSNIKIGKGEKLDINSKHGVVEIDEVDSFKGKILSTEFEIVQLHKAMDVYAEYVKDFKVYRVSRGFNELDLKGKFGSFDIGLESGLKASLSADMQFGDLKFKKEDIKMKYESRNDNYVDYRGWIGDASGSVSSIKIQASYGDVKLAYFEN
jgi:hypothetical protein